MKQAEKDASVRPSRTSRKILSTAMYVIFAGLVMLPPVQYAARAQTRTPTEGGAINPNSVRKPRSPAIPYESRFITFYAIVFMTFLTASPFCP